ncbi:MAG: hypothetical protein JXA67_10400 [Micromonosporaceae bacterium]|nr:hypothetical protein [Micromonosporaceae bacterium]
MSAELVADAFGACVELTAPVRDVVLGSLMTAVMMRGPRPTDVAALLRRALAVDERGPVRQLGGDGRPVVVLAGSGKKGVRTLNVSTPAALVAAAAGVLVVKVGSAATSSALGSRELVRALGLPEHRTADDAQAALMVCGFAFLAIEPEIPTLDCLYGGRFYAPNPFSFGLAALATPVRGDITVFGLSHPRVDVAGQVLGRYGLRHADVVTTRLPGDRYIDEIGTRGEVRCCRVRDGLVGPVTVASALDLAGAPFPVDLPAPCSHSEAIDRTADLISGGGLDDHRLVVSLNAAHLLLAAGVSQSMRKGCATADEILRSGAALTNVKGIRDDDGTS